MSRNAFLTSGSGGAANIDLSPLQDDIEAAAQTDAIDAHTSSEAGVTRQQLAVAHASIQAAISDARTALSAAIGQGASSTGLAALQAELDARINAAQAELDARIAEHRSISADTNGKVDYRASLLTDVVNTFRASILDHLAAVLNRGNALNLTGPSTRYDLGGDVAYTRAAVDTITANQGSNYTNLSTKLDTISGNQGSNYTNLSTKLDTISGNQGTNYTNLAAKLDTITNNLPTAGAYSGKVDLVNRANGLPNTGWTKASGNGVPEAFFNTVRTANLPYIVGASGLTSTTATNGLRAQQGEKAFVLPAYSANSYIFRNYDFGTAAWTTLSAIPAVSTSYYATTLGTVNGKVIALGYYINQAGTFAPTNACQTFDPSLGAWSSRAALPGGRVNQGIADLNDGRCAVFGGQTQTGQSATATAANQSDSVYIFNDTASTWTTGTNLPVKMSVIRTARRPNDGKVYLLPTFTSDGTTLTSTGRRVFLWSETGGTVECDQIPAECVASPWLLHARSDGKLVLVPYTTPSSGQRARLLDPSAASGSQWSQIDWDYNDSAYYVPIPAGCEAKPSTSGYLVSAMQNSSSTQGFTATYVGATYANWSQSFYQIKN